MVKQRTLTPSFLVRVQVPQSRVKEAHIFKYEPLFCSIDADSYSLEGIKGVPVWCFSNSSL